MPDAATRIEETEKPTGKPADAPSITVAPAAEEATVNVGNGDRSREADRDYIMFSLVIAAMGSMLTLTLVSMFHPPQDWNLVNKGMDVLHDAMVGTLSGFLTAKVVRK